MEKTEFKIGDKIYHASNSTILWIIEKIEDNDVYCSTVLKDSFEQKKEVFAMTSIVKYEKPKIRTSVIRKGNIW